MANLQAYGLNRGVQVRREKFGLLFYDYRGPRLYFVPSGELLDVTFFEGNQAVSEAVEAFHAQHDLPKDQIQERVEQIVQLLEKKGLIHGE